MYRYESQSLEIEIYFPRCEELTILSATGSRRKQSLYLDSEALKASTATGTTDTAQHSDTEESYGGFRVRSGTDISNSLISRRYRFRKTGATRAVDFSRSAIIQGPKPSISYGVQHTVDGINGEDLIKRLEHELAQSVNAKTHHDDKVDDNDDNGDDNAEQFEDAFSRQTSVRNLEELRSALNL